ncbi:MAG: phosphodiester glycosidase family protein, partial [Erysipelotrichaceae bacterium]|nr:phosphodiester glycosidase family protein [Erysipelotrichaceae bacterium]
MKRLRTKVLIILDIAAVLMLMCFYGPWHGFQDWFVTTALSTSSHRYLANILYSNIMIEEIMNRNQAIVIEDDSDADLVTFDSSEMYAINSEYEAQITEHDENQDFKVFEISGVGYNGWVTVIYDPTRLHLVTSSSSSGAKVSTLANKYNAAVAVNGGGYTIGSREKTSTGGLLADGEVVFESWQSESLITMNNEGKLILTYNSVENLADEGETDWAVCFEPFLIVNGQQSTFNGNAGGQQPRTAIGQRPDGIILLLTIIFSVSGIQAIAEDEGDYSFYADFASDSPTNGWTFSKASIKDDVLILAEGSSTKNGSVASTAVYEVNKANGANIVIGISFDVKPGKNMDTIVQVSGAQSNVMPVTFDKSGEICINSYGIGTEKARTYTAYTPDKWYHVQTVIDQTAERMRTTIYDKDSG